MESEDARQWGETTASVSSKRRLCLMGLPMLALIGCASGVISGADPSPSEPSIQASQKRAVSAFYEQVLALNVHGLPNDAQIARLAPLVSDQLLQLMQQARNQQAVDFARHGGSEPPLVQGSPFVSLFEGVTKVLAIEPGPSPDVWAVHLAWGQGSEQVQWTDLTAVALASNRWVVSDIIFNGQWDFARRGRLSEALSAVRGQAN